MFPSTPIRTSTLRRRQAALTAAAGTVLMLSLSANLTVAAQPPPKTAVRPAAVRANPYGTAPQYVKPQPLPAVRQIPQHPAGLPYYPVQPSPGDALQNRHGPQRQNAGPKEYPQPVTELRSTHHVDPNSSTRKPAVQPKHLDPLGNRIPRTTPGEALGGLPRESGGPYPSPTPTPRTSLYPPIPGASALNPKPQVNNSTAGKPLLTSHHSAATGTTKLPRNALVLPHPDTRAGYYRWLDKSVPRSGNDSASVADALRNPLPNFMQRGLEQLPVVQTPVLPEGTEFKQTDGQSREPQPPAPATWTVYEVGDGQYTMPVPSSGGFAYPTDDGLHYAWKPIVQDLLRAEALGAILDSLPREAFQDDRCREDLNALQRELVLLRHFLDSLPSDAMAYAAGLAIGQKAKGSHGVNPSSGGTLANPGGGGDGGPTIIPVQHGANQKGDGDHGGLGAWGAVTPGGGGAANNNGGGANDNDTGGGNTPQGGGANQDHGTRSPDQPDNQADDGGDAGNGGGGDGDAGDCDDGTESGPADVREAIDDVHRSSGRCENLAPDPDSGGKGGRGGGGDVGARGKLPAAAPGVTEQDKDLVGAAFGTTTGAGDEERVQVGERGNAAVTHGNDDLGQDLRGRINNGTGGATVEGVISQLWWQRNAPRAQPPK